MAAKVKTKTKPRKAAPPMMAATPKRRGRPPKPKAIVTPLPNVDEPDLPFAGADLLAEDAEPELPNVLERMREAADEVGKAHTRPRRTGVRKGGKVDVPTPEEWESWLAKIVVYGSIFYADYLLGPVADATPEDRQAVEISDEAASDIASPLSRILFRTVPAGAARKILDSDDYLALVIALWAYRLDTRDARRRHAEAVRSRRAIREQEAEGRPRIALHRPPLEAELTHDDSHAEVVAPEAARFDGIIGPAQFAAD